MSKFRNTKGYTLSELLAYMGLLLLITFFSGSFIINGLRYYRMIDVETSLQQGLIVAMGNISRDLSSANKSSLRIENNGIIFASPTTESGSFEFSNTGELLWQKWTAYYIRESQGRKVLVKKDIYMDTPSSQPGTPPFTTVAQFASAPQFERTVSEDINMLKLENAGYAGGYNLTLSLDKTTDITKPNNIEGTTEILIKN